VGLKWYGDVSWGGRCVVLLSLVAAPAEAGNRKLEINVVSNRADLISAGEALVEIKLPNGVRPSWVRVAEDRRRVTDSFALRENGRFMGLVEGLDVGKNVLRARVKRARAGVNQTRERSLPGRDRLTVFNHPNGGPVFSGPQVEPWVCQNAGATDEQCNQPAEYTYQYKPTGGGLEDYDPNDPPDDVSPSPDQRGRVRHRRILQGSGGHCRRVRGSRRSG